MQVNGPHVSATMAMATVPQTRPGALARAGSSAHLKDILRTAHLEGGTQTQKTPDGTSPESRTSILVLTFAHPTDFSRSPFSVPALQLEMVSRLAPRDSTVEYDSHDGRCIMSDGKFFVQNAHATCART